MKGNEAGAALAVVVAAARRSAIARHIQGDLEQRLLQTIVEATASLFDAEASSIALFEPDPDRLEFRVAAGAQGASAIGLSVQPTQGIAGYVYSTGQALALSDVASDPRFDRTVAERTGYVPRSIAAVPLLDEHHGSVGVLQVLDKRGEPTFSLRDMELLAVFARQATAAIAAARVQRDTSRLLAASLREVAPDLTEDEADALVAAAVDDLETDPEAPFWKVVAEVARLRTMSDRELTLVADILAVVAGHAGRSSRRSGRE